MTSNDLFIDLTSVNTKYINVGFNVDHYMKSRSWPRFGNLLEKFIWESVHHGNHIFDVFGDPK